MFPAYRTVYQTPTGRYSVIMDQTPAVHDVQKTRCLSKAYIQRNLPSLKKSMTTSSWSLESELSGTHRFSAVRHFSTRSPFRPRQAHTYTRARAHTHSDGSIKPSGRGSHLISVDATLCSLLDVSPYRTCRKYPNRFSVQVCNIGIINMKDERKKRRRKESRDTG